MKEHDRLTPSARMVQIKDIATLVWQRHLLSQNRGRCEFSLNVKHVLPVFVLRLVAKHLFYI
jgi:hypothetical protein